MKEEAEGAVMVLAMRPCKKNGNGALGGLKAQVGPMGEAGFRTAPFEAEGRLHAAQRAVIAHGNEGPTGKGRSQRRTEGHLDLAPGKEGERRT